MDSPLLPPEAPTPMPVFTSCRTEQAWNRQQLAQPVTTPAMRLWMYRAPAVVLGCSQSQLLPLPVLDSVARMAGGGAVLVGPWMLSVSIVLPPQHRLGSGSLVNSYRWLGEVFGALLRRLGIPAHAITPEEAQHLQAECVDADLGWACFGGYSPWEVVVGHQKIVGLAQVRRRTGTLLVAGLLVERPEWDLLAEAMHKPQSDVQALAERTTSCAQQGRRDVSLAGIAGLLAHELELAIASADLAGPGEVEQREVELSAI